MYEFNGSRGLGLHRRFKTQRRFSFSPSYGVRHGLIADPNWPPAPVDGDVAPPRRRSLRVPYAFRMRDGHDVTAVEGDLSAGGAMFYAANPVVATEIEILASFPDDPSREIRARARVLSRVEKSGRVAHHVQFVEPSASASFGELVFSIVGL